MQCQITRKVTEAVNIKTLKLCVPVRYEEEDIPNDFPFRRNDMWSVDIDIDTGKIKDWPQGKTGDFNMKVCDEGIYELLDENGKQLAIIEQNYVPNGLVPGVYGDYVEMQINESGVITNWPSHPNFSKFFPAAE